MIVDRNKLAEFLNNSGPSKRLTTFSQAISGKIFFETVSRILNDDGDLDFYYWNNPSQQFSFLAGGKIFTLTQQNLNDHRINDELLKQIKKNYSNNLNKQNFNKIPVILGTQKFPLKENSTIWSDFDAQKWIIPRFLLLRDGENYALLINFLNEDPDIEKCCLEIENAINLNNNIHPSENLNPKVSKHINGDITGWNSIVETALDKIAKKELEKVVPARCVKIDLESNYNLNEIKTNLEENYPECYIFVYKSKNSVFFGATPEKLFKIDKGIIETDSLAGSIQRGDSEIADNELGMQLLESEKDINEHNSVRNFLLEKLYHVTDNIRYDSKPILRKLSNIQHLWTPITARLKNDSDVFSLIENIFPTPAVCGYPTESALKLISSLENFDRGLYAGVIGWFNFEGQGDFAVALRSALIKNNTVYAFAGCGIVEGSDPLLEYNETELKLKPILSLFVNETVDQS